MNKKNFLRSSVTTKYSLGYILLSVIAVLLILISFWANSFISASYRSATDELMELNELYINIETVNTSVNNGYLYLKSNSYDEYLNESKETRKIIEKVKIRQKRNYSREVIDTVCTMETYLEESDELMKQLQNYIFSVQKTNAQYENIGTCYKNTQDTLSYINLGFQEAYATKLVSVQDTQRNIDVLRSKIMMLQMSTLLIGGLICLYYCVKVLKNVTFSLGKLTRAVKNIEEDVYQESHVDIKSNDEFEDFANALNQMIDVIQTQMHKIEENANIKERLSAAEIENLRIYGELQKSQLTLLQSRINPHFLFNTLNMISSMARIENAEKSAELMEKTAVYLRYNLDNLSKSVTLKQEIDNLKNYIYIQQYRFDDRYIFLFDIDENCENFKMPFMILQPLVENSLKHGLAMRLTGGKVWVRVRKIQNDVEKIRLEVEDNGVGIEESKLEEICRTIFFDTTQTEHIGLRNIYMRLKFFYKGKVDLQILKMEEGIKVCITLPVH